MQQNTLVMIAITLMVGTVGGYFLSQAQTTQTDQTTVNETANTAVYGRGIGQGRGMGRQDGTGSGGQHGYTQQNCLAEDCLLVDDLEYPVSELPGDVQAALEDAIMDEYTAHATYEAVIDKFGSSRPFSMIIRSEEQHIASLKAIYDKYGLEAPTYTGTVTAPATLQAACQTGVDAEIANAALYRDELLPAVTEYPEITVVFTNLMQASQEKHLPAFERCN